MANLYSGPRRYGADPSDYAHTHITGEEKQTFISSIFRWKSLFCKKSVEDLISLREYNRGNYGHDKNEYDKSVLAKYACIVKSVGEADIRKTQIAASISKVDVENNALFKKFQSAASKHGYSIKVGGEPYLNYCNYNGGGHLGIPLIYSNLYGRHYNSSCNGFSKCNVCPNIMLSLH